MKLTPLTHELLANFSTINPGIVIEGGDTIRTLSDGRYILAEGKLDVEFPQHFAIEDLKGFLNRIDLFDDPELEFAPTHLWIKDKVSSSRFVYSPDKHVKGYTDKYPIGKLPTEDVKFELSKENLEAIRRAGSTMQMPNIAIVGSKGVLVLRVLNAANPTTDTYQRVLGKTPHNFQMVFNRDNWKFLPRTYQVALSAKGAAKFDSGDVKYFIAAEASSTFSE